MFVFLFGCLISVLGNMIKSDKQWHLNLVTLRYKLSHFMDCYSPKRVVNIFSFSINLIIFYYIFWLVGLLLPLAEKGWKCILFPSMIKGTDVTKKIILHKTSFKQFVIKGTPFIYFFIFSKCPKSLTVALRFQLIHSFFLLPLLFLDTDL